MRAGVGNGDADADADALLADRQLHHQIMACLGHVVQSATTLAGRLALYEGVREVSAVHMVKALKYVARTWGEDEGFDDAIRARFQREVMCAPDSLQAALEENTSDSGSSSDDDVSTDGGSVPPSDDDSGTTTDNEGGAERNPPPLSDAEAAAVENITNDWEHWIPEDNLRSAMKNAVQASINKLN